MEKADVIVVGSGVIGTSAAYRLARRGFNVLLLDRSGIAAGTSGACDQAILLQSKKPGRHLELARASAQLYRNLEDELQMEIEYGREGGMIVIETEEQLRVMTAFVAQQRQAGLAVTLLSASEARRIQPWLSPHIVAATWSEEDAQVNPMLLARAFARGARQSGARLRFGVTVTGLLTEGHRITGVQTSDGPMVADWVVLAAGPQTAMLTESVGCSLPIRPRRGQLIVTEPVGPVIRGGLLCARYMAAKLDPDKNRGAAPGSVGTDLGVGLSLGRTASGNLLIGGSREFVGFDRSTSPAVIHAILTHAMRIVPALAQIRAIRTMAGLRPYTPDSLPIVGPVPEWSGLIVAAGHEGDGIALAPITGVMVADLLAGGPGAEMAAGLGPERFSETQTQLFAQGVTPV